MDNFTQYVCTDLLGHLNGISAKAMFGGYGIYQDGVIFALICEGQLYFKVDKNNQDYFQQHNAVQFTYNKGSKIVGMSYWQLPEAIMNNTNELNIWVQRSVQVSLSKK
jgi:DNA transformation protein and related proteins